MHYAVNTYKLWTKSIALIIMLFSFSAFTYADIIIGGNVYGGGNRGTLEGTATVVVQSGKIEGDVYGGARMADITPTSTPSDTINGVPLPAGYATHVLIWGGDVQNVYGGNDITGNITGGTNVEIYSNVKGDVYGGGNGSYVYTDKNATELPDPAYNDFRYVVGTGQTSAEALNEFRPNVEKTLVHITGKTATLTGSTEQTTYIGGRVFCGGNSATIRSSSGNPTANLKIGSHVVVDNVFLGDNGENMVNSDTLQRYANTNISGITLTDADNFAEYMRGVDMGIKPEVSFDADYVDETAYIGSFFVGGNIGSMSAAGTFNLNFTKQIIIYNKLVGGCNNANVRQSAYNAHHEGGLITAASPKVILNIEGLRLEPRTLTYANNAYTLDWNKTAEHMLIGGNIYGGCYNSGYINGGVTINIKADAISSRVRTAADGTTLQTLDAHRDFVFNTALSAFGAGYGEDSEIWGNTIINISDNADIVKVFGGGEMGVVGNLERYTSSSIIPTGAQIGDRTGDIETPYNTTINHTDGNVGKIYGGGFEGPVTGHTTVNLVGGTAYDVVGGACNADIEEYAETYVGRTNASTIPIITNNIYGANDFGGQIKGAKDYTERVSTTAADKVYNNSLLSAGAYVEYIKGRVHYIFGGAKAAYDYKDQTLYSKYCDATGAPKSYTDTEGRKKTFIKPAIDNAFVNFRPVYNAANNVSRVYGAGQGYYNERDKDLLQSNSYVLIDIPNDVEEFASIEVFGAGDYSGVGMDKAAADVRTAEASSTTDVTAAAVIDLVRGNINCAYGGSYKQGFTRRTIVNVPVGSTINMNYLYGGAYGVAAADGKTLGNLWPCDVYESNVNYKSGAARVKTIYGGNNSYRRTLYTHVNIHTPVRYVHSTYGLTHANIFGAGYGENTWAQYTEINLLDSARVYEPYGGGENGCVYNKQSIASLATTYGWSLAIPGNYETTDASYDHGGLNNTLAHSNQLYIDYNSKFFDANSDNNNDITIAEKYNTNVHIHRGATVVNYAYGAGLGSHIYTYEFDGNTTGNTLPQPSDYMAGATSVNDLDAEARAKYDAALEVYNAYSTYTSGSTVGVYEYNAFNDTQKSHWTQIAHRTTAVVSGTSYIDLLGGTVSKDIYAAGTTGSVQDTLMLKSFTASATAYIKGGMARNVYGGGWEGPVGKHNISSTATTYDVLGETHVIVGRPEEDIASEYTVAVTADPTIDEDEFFYFNGVPSIRRNAYAGGEGGVVRGTANLNIFNGVVGYQCKHKDDITESENNYYKLEINNGHVKYTALKRGDDLSGEDYYYVEDIDQDVVGDNIMYEAGNAFGGGYAANSDVDIANLTLWDGIIRNSMYGGGEIATIGRGIQTKNTTTQELEVTIYKPGETHVTMMGGHVLRDVFGGGRGFNNWKTEDKSEGNTNGFVFGKTDVNIHFGTVGTLDGMSKGYGNVFGGGNVGFVYSQYAKQADGWYYEDYTSSSKVLSEDTRVEVKAYAKALDTVTVGGTIYNERDYIPNDKLDLLSNSDEDKPTWAKIDQSGITIYNAVFAGGNVSAGSDKIMAFSKTVYGNSSASIVDIYARDLISVGGNGVGGLYGDGNLTFVDGYRELNITNYGTDWFSLSGGVDSDAEFYALTPRQQSFYTTQYECITAYGSYDRGDVILSDIYLLMTDADKTNWKRKQSIINEGRYINTVQRCDFCGIKGSRLVLHGAIDRAQDESEADYTKYTINRVGELSLNQNHDHGSYFGIYNVVKFLGGITSDVYFAGADGAVRKTESASTGDYAADGRTYYAWKQSHINDNMRNDGTAPNKIALSSGVFLEIVKELDANGNKIYGPITGVVELDLLNVSAGEGGGYVYAKNIHGTPHYTATYADVISDANKNLVTNRAFEYDAATTSDHMQTSGNFIHSLPKHILDDCFPESKSFVGANASPAHYWYIRGEYYVYEQLVSAYTGGADAYSKDMSIPLTMSIQGNAKLRLLNVLPGLYADPSQLQNYTYNTEDPELSVSDSISIVNNAVVKTYGQGDPISYWDWYNATNAERAMFIVETDAMVCSEEVTIDGRTYYPGETIRKDAYNALSGKQAYDSDHHVIVDNYGDPVDAQNFFNVINEVSHANGYQLTIDFSNPSKWDDYYRHLVDQTTDPADPIKKAKLQELLNACADETARKDLLDAYIKSTTFTCNATGTYGQYYFYKDDVISHNVYEMQTSDVSSHASSTQATFESAYMAKDDCEVSIGSVLKSFTKGTPISASEYAAIANASTYFEPAYICVSTVLVANGDYRVLNQLVGETEYNSWSTEVKEKFQSAYYCMSTGSWGGKYYVAGQNYNGVDYGQLLEQERTYFTFNYDALDLLLYGNYVKDITNGAYRYDEVNDFKNYITNIGGTNHNTAISVFDADAANNPFYSISAKIDYTATFNSNNHDDEFKYVKDGASIDVTVGSNAALTNDQYESLPNDRKYYAAFSVSDEHLKDKDGNNWSDGKYHTFIVGSTFDVAGTMYNAGKAITHANYTNLTTTQQHNVTEVVLDADGTYFYCIERYTVGANDANVTNTNGSAISAPDTVKAITGATYAKGTAVPVGTVIDQNMMRNIPNYQIHFEIKGETPIEETTLYVPVSADINALQKDRYVTAIYEYTYTESDASGMNYETRVEKHIINIRIKFLSGTPVIGPLKEPDLVLPLETVGLDIPTIQEGAFPILGGGWEIYPTEDNAKRHRNGREYLNGGEQLYFYQNDYYVAYYALTRMGKTFSDPVPLKVANYQRMADVINDPHHMYINHRDNDRDPKIYIDGRSSDTNGNPIKENERTYANELDAMQGMWNIVNSDYGTEYSEMVDLKQRNITGANGLEFFLQSEVSSQLPSWTSIGDDTQCFGGLFHGNGNTIKGLNNSLFGKLCGRVYNLGVMGNFTTGGIANTGEGRIENSWVWSSGTISGQPVYANPTTPGAKVINTYFPNVNNTTYTASTGDIEITPRTVEDFVNGSVAYDLNRYYLEARYRTLGQKNDGTVTNHYFFRLPDGTLEKDTTTQIVDANGKLPSETGYIPTYASLIHEINYADTDYARFDKQEGTNIVKVGYVEKYVADGDFRYSDGNKPLKADLRQSSTVHGYIPLYPDDYIFFGQKLTYDILNDADGNPIAHAMHPQAASKSHTTGSDEDVDNSKHGLLINDITDRSENRIFRAPAYFRNGIYGSSVIFNARAAFVDSYNFTINGTSYATLPHHNMTAIDFTGGNGDTHGYQGVIAGVATDFTDRANGYHPLLDYERLDAFQTQGLTQNLLAYTPTADLPGSKNTQTNSVLVNYFRDLAYTEIDRYRNVEIQNTGDVKGHVVQQSSTEIANSDYTYQATLDHLLVDHQDFNAPMAYTYADGKRMWYQRVPDNYADRQTGWEAISLPFTAEILTTQDKGELTHFYKNSEIGHEYWLREFKAGGAASTTDSDIYVANFALPESTGELVGKTDNNTFLWDYYYTVDEYQDANRDEYQKNYYQNSRQYDGYPFYQKAKPYILGLPGARYFEFDLSGNFEPQNRLAATNIDKLDPQVITLASNTGVSIAKSDTELASGKVTADGYTFMPSYLNEELPISSSASNYYALNTTGNSFDVTTSIASVGAFRPYFTTASSSPSKQYRSIIFGDMTDTDFKADESINLADHGEGLRINAGYGTITIESGLDTTARIRIVNAAGITMTSFMLEPGATVTTPLVPGVYIVAGKKVTVR